MLQQGFETGGEPKKSSGHAGEGKASPGSLSKFKRVADCLNFEDERKRSVVESLRGNRFRFLLEMPQESDKLKQLIFARAQSAWPGCDVQLLKKSVDYVDYFYQGVYRKDGKTEASVHIYSVAYGCLLLGCGFETLIAALFHDIPEDTRERWSRATKAQATREIIEIAGQDIHDKARTLTRNPLDEYPKYLSQIYQSRDMELMVVKAVDMVNNLFTLYFEGCSEKMRDSVVRKAIYHVDIWRKFNREFFDLMFALIRDNAPDKPGSRAQEEILAKIDVLRHPSMRQLQKEKDKVVIVNSRKALDLSLFSDLPNSGSQVITVYMPRHLEADNALEVEFPAGAGSEGSVLSRLHNDLPWMAFTPVKSELPSELVCSTIFRAEMPPANRQGQFLDALRALASGKTNLHGKTTEFYNGA